jgi:hypothetical protein
MADVNRQVVLAARPDGYPVESDFRVEEAGIPNVGEGQFLLRNAYISLDAGFRNWMNEDSGDDVLPAMALDAPVMGLVLGQVVESKHPDYPEGAWLMARLAWEEYSLSDGSDFISRLPEPRECPLPHYLGILGDTGLSAYFGLLDIGRPQPGETVLVSAAGGAVGNVVGQLAKIHGAKAVGLAGTDEKCARLVDELGFHAAVNHRSADLAGAIAAACPDRDDPNHEIYAANLEALRGATDARGRTLEVITVDQPTRMEEDGRRLASSYVNFYIANGGVVMPAFEDRRDDAAYRTVAAAFPDRKVVQVPSSDIIIGGGCIHCITQQQPKAE